MKSEKRNKILIEICSIMNEKGFISTKSLAKELKQRKGFRYTSISSQQIKMYIRQIPTIGKEVKKEYFKRDSIYLYALKGE